jgi:zinc-ribbon domain
MFCTACGTGLPSGASFCPSCGSPLHAVAAQALPARPGQRSNRRSTRGAGLAAAAAATLVAVAGGGAWLLLRPGTPEAVPTVAVVAPSASPSVSPAAPTPVAAPSAADAVARAARDAAVRRAAAQRRQALLQAAGRIDHLLDASTTARSEVVAATQGLAECALPAGAAAAGLEHVISLRRRLLDQLDVVDFGPLSHSAQLRAALTQAWEASLDADVSYLAWAENQDVYGACDTADADYLAGNASSARAVAAKKRFASLWNRYVAGPLDLVPRSDGRL